MQNVYSCINIVVSRLGTAGDDDDGELKHAHKVTETDFSGNYAESESVLKMKHEDDSLCRPTRRSSIGFSSNTCTAVPKGSETPTTGTDFTYLAAFSILLHLQRYVENGGGSHDTTGPRIYCPSLWM